MEEGVLYNIVFIEYPFKWVSDDVNAFHRIALRRFLHNHGSIAKEACSLCPTLIE